MNSTLVTAQILGIVITISGLSILFNRKGMAMLIEDISRNAGLMWLYGFVVLTLGAVLVALDGSWGHGGLRTLVAVIGWLSVLKGFFLLLLPQSVVSFYRKMGASIMPWSGTLAVILGLVLLYKSLM